MKRQRTPLDIEQKLISSLRAKGYKLTTQRLDIIKFLSRDLSHPGARDILQKVRKTVPRLSLSTVYYTLEMMKKEGLIREIDFYDRDNRYDTNTLDHINLVCTKCGRITDLMGDMPSFSKAVEKETGFKPASMRFEYYGYCKECRRARRR